jgi:7-keto-8-aminopelargonate synthetase-like enzyme
LIVTESVFSMDGDHAPLRQIADLKDKYGAWLMVDEAHGTGLYGANRRGLAEALGVGDRVEIQMGTLGKAIGASGGAICGSRALIDCLINRARSFIFSTAPVPAAAAAATAGLRLVQSEAGKERRNLLWRRVAELQAYFDNPTEARAARFGVPPSGGSHATPSDGGTPSQPRAHFPSAIIPIVIGDEAKTVHAAAALRDMGILIPAIRFPSVARGRARLRLTVSASHTAADIAQVAAALSSQLGAALCLPPALFLAR